ncbi:hypothetical protein DM860_004129 [Cuscuta australis]|uniref:Arabinogalactan peptide 16 n=1 Tax=Cuscuta australis TaxID=267555 RepID=A0A328CV74_9ASTE|nr:hypothetical protein DM860_004129 [Cuscuta australis]
MIYIYIFLLHLLSKTQEKSFWPIIKHLYINFLSSQDLVSWRMNNSSKCSKSAMAILGFALMGLVQLGSSQEGPSPSPSPLAPSSDGVAVDQGIAYVLLLLALAVTYLVH